MRMYVFKKKKINDNFLDLLKENVFFVLTYIGCSIRCSWINRFLIRNIVSNAFDPCVFTVSYTILSIGTARGRPYGQIGLQSMRTLYY